METIDRLNYSGQSVADTDAELGFTVKQTLNQGINDNGVVSFRIPADSERFTDLNTVCIRVDCQILSEDGSALKLKKIKKKDSHGKDVEREENPHSVLFDRNGLHSFFSTCDVRFNDDIVSTMSSYPYSACLSRFVGCAKEIRDDVWDVLDGTWWLDMKTSSLAGEDSGILDTLITRDSEKSKHVSLIGRVYSDVLMSSRQYLPPGVSLGVELRRAPDSFSLVSTKEGQRYTLKLHSASLYVRRLRIQPSLLPRTLSTLQSDPHLLFNRLETRTRSIPKGQTVWEWNDCLNGNALPNRLYIGFVSQSSLYGSPTQLCTYFEHFNVSSINLKLNGRDIMVEPIKTTFVKNADGFVSRNQSYGQEGYLSLLDVMDMIKDQIGAVRMSYDEWLHGNTIFAVELSKSGQQIGQGGSLDLHLTFGTDGKTGSDREGNVILFTEKTDRIPLQSYIKAPAANA